MSDVVIVGAGPAGLTLGCYLAGAGVPCLIVERAHHPRAHVGESLMPATVRIFREIGFLPVMEAADFPRSGGVVYHPGGGGSLEISYGEFPQEGVEQDHTYHVDRSKLDMLLLKHAENVGCRVLQGVGVQDVVFDTHGHAAGVQAAVADQPLFLPAKVVVDAAGRGTRLGRQLDIRRDLHGLDQFALHAWFVGVDRGRRATERYTHVFFVPELRAWAWQAPINDEITSIGLVTDKTAYQEADRDIEEFFSWGLSRNDALAKATKRAERINDLKGEANYSYRLDRVCGDGWLAIGDAACFVDPVLSSGVSVAMHTARFASERIRVAIESDDFSRATFLPYESRVLTGAATWEELVRLFYRAPSALLHVLASPEHRPAALRLIQGEVDPTANTLVLDEMQSAIRRAEAANSAASGTP